MLSIRRERGADAAAIRIIDERAIGRENEARLYGFGSARYEDLDPDIPRLQWRGRT